MSANKKVGGLAGVSAGETSLCTVGKEGAGLTYRGYDIYDLAENANFEEVAYLLMHGSLPTQAEFDAYITSLKSLRGLPEQVRTVLVMIPADRPYSESFAMATASSSPSTRTIGATGPNVSSRKIRMSGVTPVRTVGS